MTHDLIMETLKGRRKTKMETVTALDLQSLLQCRNIDTKRFEPIGAEFYQQFEDCFNAAIVCIDRQRLLANEPYLVKIILEDFTNEEHSQFSKKFEAAMASEKKNFYSLNFAEILLQSEVTINYISNGKFST